MKVAKKASRELTNKYKTCVLGNRCKISHIRKRGMRLLFYLVNYMYYDLPISGLLDASIIRQIPRLISTNTVSLVSVTRTFTVFNHEEAKNGYVVFLWNIPWIIWERWRYGEDTTAPILSTSSIRSRIHSRSGGIKSTPAKGSRSGPPADVVGRAGVDNIP